MKAFHGVLLICGAFLLLRLSACLPKQGEGSYYVQLPRAEWAKEDTLRFDLFMPESPCSLQLKVQIRLNNNYEWLELPIGYTLQNSLGYEKCGQLEIQVAAKPGDYKNFVGSYRQMEVSIEPHISLREAGIYVVFLYPLIDKPLLRGVENVGIAMSYN